MMMTKQLNQFAFALLTMGLVGLRASGAIEPSTDGSDSLAEAISSFNAKAKANPIGMDQPPLTEDEVVGAIRWWDFHREDAPVSNEEYRAFRRIAETHLLPQGAQFEVLTGFEPDNKVAFDAWSVRISLPRPSGGTYAFVIRERILRSRLIGAEEHKVIEKWSRSPMGSFQREEYRKEREAAAALDRSNEK